MATRKPTLDFQLPRLEKDIQREICEYLQHLADRGRLFFWRQNTIPPSYIDKGGQRQFRSMPKYSLNGVPDIIIVKGPHVIFLEVKRKGTVQSPSQKDFEELCKIQGAEYYVVRKLDDVLPLGLEAINR